MALDSEVSAVEYAGNDSTEIPYPVPFSVLEPEHVRVSVLPRGTGTVTVTDGTAVFSQPQTALTAGGRVRIGDSVHTVTARAGDTQFTLNRLEPTGGPVPFYLPDTASLLEPDTGFTLDEDGVRTAAAAAPASIVTVFRRVPLTQPVVLPDSGALPPSALETMADRLTMILQQLARQIEGAGIGKDNGSGPGHLLEDTAVFANTAARAATTPKRTGQLGVQLDTGTIYRATSTATGQWGVAGVGVSGFSTDKALTRWEGSAGTTLQSSMVTLSDGGDLETLNSVGVWSTQLTRPSTGDQLLIRSTQANTAGRVHIEPNAQNLSGTTAKLDLMGDAFNLDQTSYRIGNLFYYNGNSPADNGGAAGQNGTFFVGAKNVGDTFGVWADIDFGFQDNNSNGGAVIRLCYMDHSDTAWFPDLLPGCWRQGRTVSAGQRILASNKRYIAANGGTTGATKPAHSTGAQSDGGVNWTFERDYAASAGSIKPVARIGYRTDRPKFGMPNVAMQLMRDVSLDNGCKLLALSNSAPVATPLWSLSTPANGTDFRISSEAVSNASLRFLVSGGLPAMQWNGLAELDTAKAAPNGAATPDVSQTTQLALNNTSPTLVTGFTSALPRQRFTVIASNANTTLVHSANLILPGGVNRVIATNEAVLFVTDNSGLIFTLVGSRVYSAGNGLQITGNTFSIDNTIATLSGSQALTNKSYNGVTLSTVGGAGNFLNAQGNYLTAVTSIEVSGGSTGLTFSGGPVTTSGTVTLQGTLGVANGGTGVSSITGIIKGGGIIPFQSAVPGTDYVTPDGEEMLTNKTIVNNHTTLASGPVITWNPETYPDAILYLEENVTLSIFPIPLPGAHAELKIIQGGVGGYMVTWPPDVRWPGGTPPALSTDPAAMDVFSFRTALDLFHGGVVGLDYSTL